MITMSTPRKRLGFACKWLNSKTESKDKAIRAAERELNTSSTTVAWLNRQTRSAAEDKLWSVAKHNVASIYKLMQRVATLDPSMHMMRISSDILPVYTEPTWRYFWQQPDVMQWCEIEFAKLGEYARSQDIRLSFHPGQFCVLASESDDIVGRSIEEFEYHVNMARWMGYGKSWHDHGFKINVHIAGRRGPQGIIDVLGRLTPEARNLITIENDEMSWGVDASLELKNHVALVLDIHHHLINTGGEYFQVMDNRWKQICDSWRGIRPVIHYSLSREDILVNHCVHTLPNIAAILANGQAKKAKLRAHSDDAWNLASNKWALEFWNDSDIMLEAKYKNIATKTLLEQYHASV